MAILELIKWPVVVVILGLVALGLFKANIAALINRIRRFGPKGFESPLDTPPTPQTLSTPESSILAVPSSAATQADVLQPFINPLELRVEQQFREMIKSFNGSDKEIYLLKSWVRSAIQLHFEKTFQSIYRSQINALTALNSSGMTAPPAVMKFWYDLAATENPAIYASYTFEQWLTFMARAFLINVGPESVSLTTDGKEFLKFLIDRGYTAFTKAN